MVVSEEAESSSDDADDAKTSSDDASPSDDFENLKHLKTAFDNLETDKDTTTAADGQTTDEIPAGEDEKNETLKGPVDDK